MSRPPIPWTAADLLDLARAAEALGALSFQMAERFGPDDGLELSCRATAALLDRVLRDEAEADHAREMQERSPIGESEESGEEAVPHGGPAPQGKA